MSYRADSASVAANHSATCTAAIGEYPDVRHRQRDVAGRTVEQGRLQPRPAMLPAENLPAQHDDHVPTHPEGTPPVRESLVEPAGEQPSSSSQMKSPDTLRRTNPSHARPGAFRWFVAAGAFGFGFLGTILTGWRIEPVFQASYLRVCGCRYLPWGETSRKNQT